MNLSRAGYLFASVDPGINAGITYASAPFAIAWILYAKLGSELTGSWLNQNGAIREDNRRHTSCAFIHAHNDFGCTFILFNIDVLVGNAMSIKPALRETAISAPGGRIHLNFFSSVRSLYGGFCHK